ncbi:hypothetical protein EDB19DRAFT_1707246 [Suillus lakei]|nr:hypothetical protein EDB19DRAFT_1819279 [Suillus lakei]KAG1740994.1 hypothetical protein EDB19DRAFT_1707246 [Suillus lakei]
MLARLSTAFVILFGLTALVNAGTVPVARAVGDLDKRSDAVGNYAEPALYAEPRSVGVVSLAPRINLTVLTSRYNVRRAITQNRPSMQNHVASEWATMQNQPSMQNRVTSGWATMQNQSSMQNPSRI